MSERVFEKYRKNCIGAFVEVIHLRAENVSNEVLVKFKTITFKKFYTHTPPWAFKYLSREIARGKWS